MYMRLLGVNVTKQHLLNSIIHLSQLQWIGILIHTQQGLWVFWYYNAHFFLTTLVCYIEGLSASVLSSYWHTKQYKKFGSTDAHILVCFLLVVHIKNFVNPHSFSPPKDTSTSDWYLFHITAAQKSDMWWAVDPVSGTKLHTYTIGSDISSTCPLADVSGPILHIARTGIQTL